MGDSDYYGAQMNPAFQRRASGRRKATASQWAAANPVMDAGEVGIETNYGREKVADGVTAWLGLFYGVTSPTRLSIVVLTQSAYAAISSPDPSTLYVVTG